MTAFFCIDIEKFYLKSSYDFFTPNLILFRIFIPFFEQILMKFACISEIVYAAISAPRTSQYYMANSPYGYAVLVGV